MAALEFETTFYHTWELRLREVESVPRSASGDDKRNLSVVVTWWPRARAQEETVRYIRWSWVCHRALLTLCGMLFAAIGAFSQSDPRLPEEFTAMRPALCDKATDFTEMGCKVCPKFMAEGAELPLNGGLGINGILFGSFTSVGKTEAFLNSYGCFGHADGFASAFLLRKEQGSWRRLSFFHRDGPLGICQKIPGQSDKRDLLICNYEDYGAGAISVIAFDANGKVKTESVLVQTWTFPFRSLEKQKHCSSLQADVRKVSFNSIEISIFPNSFDVDPPIICDESDYTTSKIFNSKKTEAIAVFVRNEDNFAPDERTKKLLSEVEKSR